MNENFRRFVKTYIRPFWGRMTLVMVLAGVTSSYWFVLGFLSKVTVDHVLQLRPGAEAAQGQELRGRDSRMPDLRDGAVREREGRPLHRDPQVVLPGLGGQEAAGPKKTRTEQLYWLWVIFFAYLLVRMTFAASNWFYMYNISFVGHRIVSRVRVDLHEKVQKLQMTFFDRQQTGKIMSRILDDVGLLQSEVTSTFVETVRHVTRLLIGIVILLMINPKLGLLALLALPLYVVAYKVFQHSIAVTSLRMREAYAEAYGILEERVRGIRVVLSFARERGELRAFFRRVATTFRLSVKRWMLNTGLGATCSAVSAVATALVFYWGALAVKSGEMTVGDLVYFNMSLGALFMPLVALTNINATILEMLVVISRVFEVLDEEVLIQDRPGAVRLDRVRGRVAFQHVWFRYSERGDYVLKDLRFEVKPGTSVAVVGPSGSGKSTLLSLLLRLYEPTEGSVLIDDYDIRDVKLSSLRKHIGMVPQEPILFSGTVAENIVYGRDDATPDQIMEAAKAAELHDFIISLPEKYEAHVGERGGNLSGGQKQRLAFAMALLHDPSILILDDTTSALDARTESRIQQTLDRVMKGRTTFVITHRISTAMRAERVLVLDNGRMAGWGKHEDLIREGGVYRRIYEQQQAQAEDELPLEVDGEAVKTV